MHPLEDLVDVPMPGSNNLIDDVGLPLLEVANLRELQDGEGIDLDSVSAGSRAVGLTIRRTIRATISVAVRVAATSAATATVARAITSRTALRRVCGRAVPRMTVFLAIPSVFSTAKGTAVGQGAPSRAAGGGTGVCTCRGSSACSSSTWTNQASAPAISKHHLLLLRG